MHELQLKSISKSFGANKVISNMSVDFSCGTVSAIVGDNGAGKTTLCKIISGALKPDQGQIILNGQNITFLSASKLRQSGIEMIYQDLALAGQHSIISNLFMGRELVNKFGFLDQKTMLLKSKVILDKLDISLPNLKTLVSALSGGQKQAIAIARSLLFSPKILIMDEPTAALAVKEIKHVLEIIKKLKEQSIIVILISHRLNDIFEISDRIIVMGNGKILSDKKIDETSMNDTVSQILMSNQ